jgi:hypothetical protein
MIIDQVVIFPIPTDNSRLIKYLSALHPFRPNYPRRWCQRTSGAFSHDLLCPATNGTLEYCVTFLTILASADADYRVFRLTLLLRRFYSDSDMVRRGPVPLEHIVSACGRTLPAECLVWRKGMKDWTLLRDVPEVLPPALHEWS